MQIVDFAVSAVVLDYFLNLKQLAFCLKAEAFALCFAVRDSAISKYANFLIAAMVAYAFSLIDLIPDLF
ncbi:hypothetical protein [Nitrosomonas communis]|uniref:hypothetical protein n=1 Tax=Nitrosomonas communis TaxID=44574 RepID=UPI003D279687